MASKTTSGCFCLTVFALLPFVRAFIDIEELQSINYGINIAKEPVIIPEHYPESAILVTSRHGQQYQCNYPTHHEQRQQKEEEEKLAMEKGVVELLRPLTLKPCMIKTKDWWTYEVCFGQYVRQYHMEDGSIKGNIMYLGQYQSDFDWNNETLRDARVRSKIASGRYHSQYYTNGSMCDLTGQGRQSEVRFLCEEGEDDFIVRVDEPETCVYVFTVHTSRICRHPHLKSPKPTQPIPIICNPLLTEQQFVMYQKHTEALRLKEEEAQARAKAEQERKEKEEAEAAAQKHEGDLEEELTDSLNTILKKTIGKDLYGKTDASTSDGSLTDLEKELPGGWKMVKDLDDLEKLLDPQGILSNMAMSGNADHKSDAVKKMKVDKNPTIQSLENLVEEMVKASQQAVQDAGTEGNQKAISQEQMVKASQLAVQDAGTEGNQKASSQEERSDLDPLIFGSDLDEFEQEVKTLRDKQTLTEQRLQQIKNKVKKAVTSQFKDIIEEAEAEIGGQVDESVALAQLATNLNMLMDKLEDTEKELKQIDEEMEDTASKYSDKDKSAQPKGDGTHAGEESEKTESSKGVQAPPSTLRSDDDDESLIKMATKLASSQKVLESHFREQLERAGIDPSSVKVHVKIIGAPVTSDDDDDDSLHVITDDGNHQFQSMIVAILGGGSNEAIKEQNRQTSLEDGYGFVLDNVIADNSDNDAFVTSSSADNTEHSADNKEHSDDNNLQSFQKGS